MTIFICITCILDYYRRLTLNSEVTKMKGAILGVAAIGFTVLSALLFIVMGIVFFLVNVWIIKAGAGIAGYKTLDGNWVIITAGILSAASILASAIRK
jgi:hypothetical protein